MSRYYIEALDPCSYTILDKAGTGLAYILLVLPIQGPHVNVQIAIAEIANEGKSNNFIEYAKEVFSFKLYASDWEQSIKVVSHILTKLNEEDMDAGNPVEFASVFGGELHGLEMQWPSYPIKELH